MDDDAVYAARIELCDFLIAAFWDVPDESFIESLLEGTQLPEKRVNDALEEGFSELEAFIDVNRDRPVAAVRADLKREYSQLFVGPRPPVLAHETHYREDTEFIGEGLAEVQASYSAAGWSSPEEYPEEDDFLAVELAFLRDLLARQRRGQAEAFGYERVFLDEHLGRWVDPFVADVLDRSDERFYRAAAHVLQGVVEFEDELVAQMVS
ncbi:molecular chaperone TorD [Halobacteriales archaeon QS_8_65_32]|jgi:TorA maturation chaperone TorD|nr:MAG: molecular chaperone TorD [Halobacteriales archaeon QS_8_65_32]